MDPDARRASRLPAALAALLVLFGYVWLVERFLGWQALARSFAGAGAWPPLLVLAGLLGSYGLRALRLRRAAGVRGTQGTAELLRVFALYNLSNWLLPARLGEASLPLLLQRRFGLPLARGAGVLLWLRVLDLHVLAVLGGIALGCAGQRAWQALGIAALLTGLLLPWACLRFVGRLAARCPATQPLADAAPSRRAAVAGDLALAWAAWGAKLGALGAALSLLSGLAYPAAVMGALGGDVSGALPLHAPLGAGSYEAGVMLGLLPWRPDLKAALSAAVQLHALMLGGVLLLGALGLPSLRRRTPPPA